MREISQVSEASFGDLLPVTNEYGYNGFYDFDMYLKSLMKGKDNSRDAYRWWIAKIFSTIISFYINDVEHWGHYNIIIIMLLHEDFVSLILRNVKTYFKRYSQLNQVIYANHSGLGKWITQRYL